MHKKSKDGKKMCSGRTLLFMALLIFVFPVLLPGCRTAAGTMETQEYLPPDNSATTIADGTNMGEELLTAFRENDPVAARKNLAPELAAQITDEGFRNLRNALYRMGDLKESSFLTDLQQGPVKTLVWKVTFQQEATMAMPMERLFRINLGKLDDKLMIISFNFN